MSNNLDYMGCIDGEAFAFVKGNIKNNFYEMIFNQHYSCDGNIIYVELSTYWRIIDIPFIKKVRDEIKKSKNPNKTLLKYKGRIHKKHLTKDDVTISCKISFKKDNIKTLSSDYYEDGILTTDNLAIFKIFDLNWEQFISYLEIIDYIKFILAYNLGYIDDNSLSKLCKYQEDIYLYKHQVSWVAEFIKDFHDDSHVYKIYDVNHVNIMRKKINLFKKEYKELKAYVMKNLGEYEGNHPYTRNKHIL